MQEVIPKAEITPDKFSYSCVITFYCPNCGSTNLIRSSIRYKQKYCQDCGSKFIWKVWENLT